MTTSEFFYVDVPYEQVEQKFNLDLNKMVSYKAFYDVLKQNNCNGCKEYFQYIKNIVRDCINNIEKIYPIKYNLFEKYINIYGEIEKLKVEYKKY
jgi:hypothetical protein